MPNETNNLKLKLYDPDADANERVYDFIKNVTGYNNSNMTKIDDMISNLSSEYLSLSGGTMTGNITMGTGTKIIGSLEGTATKATQDANGNPIATSYSRVSNNAEYHNSIYRGKNITSKFNDGSLFENISNGTFDDLYIGDYFTKPYDGVNTTFLLAGFDMYYNHGNPSLTKHHAVVVPKDNLASSPMNSSVTTVGGYLGSKVAKEIIPDIDAKLEAMVGSAHLIQYRDYLTNNVNTSIPSGGVSNLSGSSVSCSWVDTKSRLMSEIDVCGSLIFSSSGYDAGIAHHQLPLFMLAPRTICTRSGYWLSAVASSTSFCAIGGLGNPYEVGATSNNTIRPRFIIG